LAKLQLAKSCSAKKTALSNVAEAADPRSVPALVLTAERGKSGCGRSGEQDCLACMRAPLEALIDQLGGKAQP
jgi:hypothetical protein